MSLPPNQINDQYPKNDTLTMEIEGAPVTYNKLLVNVRTDEAPAEISWQVLATGVFNGHVLVRQAAQKTNASALEAKRIICANESSS